MTGPELRRETFTTSRAADFLERSALVSQTGRDVAEWGHVIAKELLDNAVDGCETAGVAPEITAILERGADGIQRVTITDNGPGMPADVVARVLDFATTTSDKRHYRWPARGAQGNALKTIIGIAYVLGTEEPVIISSRGIRHVIISPDLAGDAEVNHGQAKVAEAAGTSVTVALPEDTDVAPC